MGARVPRREADGHQRAQARDDRREDLARRPGGDQEDDAPEGHEPEGREDRQARLQQDGADDRDETERPAGAGQGRGGDLQAFAASCHSGARDDQASRGRHEEADLDRVGDGAPDQRDEADGRQHHQDRGGAGQQVAADIALRTRAVPAGGGGDRGRRPLGPGGRGPVHTGHRRCRGSSGLRPGRVGRMLRSRRHGGGPGDIGRTGDGGALRRGRLCDRRRRFGCRGPVALRGGLRRGLLRPLRLHGRGSLRARTGPGRGLGCRRRALGGGHALRDPVDLALHEVEPEQDLPELAAERGLDAGIVGR